MRRHVLLSCQRTRLTDTNQLPLVRNNLFPFFAKFSTFQSSPQEFSCSPCLLSPVSCLLSPVSCLLRFWLPHISFKAEKKFERLRGIRLECFVGQWKVEKVAIAGEFRSGGRLDFFKSHGPFVKFGFDIFLFE